MRQALSEQELIRAHELRTSVYDRHSAGCCWHVVLDDGNYEDSSVAFCGQYALGEDTRCGNADCVELIPLLSRMSLTQRAKLARGGYKALAASRKAKS